MSFDADTDFDPENPDWTPRPTVLPIFKVPSRVAAPAAWGLVTSAALAVVAALVNAVFYRQPPEPEGFPVGVKVYQPSLGFADRVSLFDRDAASLTIALLLVLTAIVAAMAVSQDRDTDRALNRWRALLGVTVVLGTIVVLANIAQAIVILNNSAGLFTAIYSANKPSSILALLPAALGATGAVLYAFTRLRN